MLQEAHGKRYATIISYKFFTYVNMFTSYYIIGLRKGRIFQDKTAIQHQNRSSKIGILNRANLWGRNTDQKCNITAFGMILQ
jgi:hypothetical protein